MTAKVELLTPSGGKVILDPTDTAVDRVLTLPAVAGTVFNQGNVVGTVSQSSGVPTGAVIESGSNANGRFVKYADGTMIVTKKITDLDSATVDIRFSATAANFINADFIAQVTPQDRSSSAALSARKLFCIITPDPTGNPSTSTFHRIIINTGGSTNADGAYITAIGRWF